MRIGILFVGLCCASELTTALARANSGARPGTLEMVQNSSTGRPLHMARGQPSSRKAPVQQPFIRPIAPMRPLFTSDDFSEASWSTFGVRRVLRHARLRIPVLAAPVAPAAEKLVIRALPPAGPPLRKTAEMFASQQSIPTPDDFHASSTPSSSLSTAALSSLGIGPERAERIQAALQQFGYLSGTPTGAWDASSVAAMSKLQADHHWQTKFAPDARALILLGLGPGSP